MHSVDLAIADLAQPGFWGGPQCTDDQARDGKHHPPARSTPSRRPCHCAGRMVFTRQGDGSYVGLDRTVCLHRIWPYVWWFPCQKYRTYTVYTYKCMVLANPILTRWKCWGTQDSQCRRPCHCAGRMMFTRQGNGSCKVEVLRHSGLSVQTPMPLRRQNDVYQTGWWFLRGGSAEALRTLSADAHATAQAEWCLPDRVMVLLRWKCWGIQESQCRRPYQSEISADVSIYCSAVRECRRTSQESVQTPIPVSNTQSTRVGQDRTYQFWPSLQMSSSYIEIEGAAALPKARFIKPTIVRIVSGRAYKCAAHILR